MGALKQLLIAVEEGSASPKELQMWGALSLDNEHLIPEMLHDNDKPWLQGSKGAHELACEVEI